MGYYVGVGPHFYGLYYVTLLTVSYFHLLNVSSLNKKCTHTLYLLEMSHILTLPASVPHTRKCPSTLMAVGLPSCSMQGSTCFTVPYMDTPTNTTPTNATPTHAWSCDCAHGDWVWVHVRTWKVLTWIWFLSIVYTLTSCRATMEAVVAKEPGWVYDECIIMRCLQCGCSWCFQYHGASKQRTFFLSNNYVHCGEAVLLCKISRRSKNFVNLFSSLEQITKSN